jgi:hypothetical protein
MKDVTGKYKFKVPENSGHQDAGKQFEKEYDYVECENADEATKVAEDKGWTLLEFVNDKLMNSARSSSYQNALAVYRPSEVSPDEIKARMVRDFIRLGLSEEVAKTQVESILSANNG